MHDVFVHGGNATADDHLEAVAALRHRAEHALHVLETILIDLGCVNQFKAPTKLLEKQSDTLTSVMKQKIRELEESKNSFSDMRV